MIRNGHGLLLKAPLSPMEATKRKEHGVSYGLSEAGYDIRIAQDIAFTPSSCRTGMIVSVNGERREGRFCLASTVETFNMPDDLVAIVHDKSTWARHGLSVFNTVIEPGWKGVLTLELVYHGHSVLHIPAGAGIAQVIFHETTELSKYNGKYQNQGALPQPPIMESPDGKS